MDEDKSKRNHFPRKEILDLAIYLEAELEAFIDQSFILKNIKPHRLCRLLGQDQQGEVVYCGLRLQKEINDHHLESHPSFYVSSLLNHPFDTTLRGVVKLSHDRDVYNLDIMVDKLQGSDDISYSLTLIPSFAMPEEVLAMYLTCVVDSLMSQKTEP